MILEDCWIWKGETNESGYGLYEGRLLHRLSYTAHCGTIPKGMVLDHLCRVRSCYNPAHLEPVTDFINLSRGNKRSQTYAKERYGKTKFFALLREDSYTKAHLLCATCGRRDDQPCVDRNGKTKRQWHVIRRRLIDQGGEL